MASLADIARARRADFRRLLKSSRTLDASQEALEREIKRLTTRKTKVPEVEDAQRILGLMGTVQAALNDMASLMETISTNWRTL